MIGWLLKNICRRFPLVVQCHLSFNISIFRMPIANSVVCIVACAFILSGCSRENVQGVAGVRGSSDSSPFDSTWTDPGSHMRLGLDAQDPLRLVHNSMDEVTALPAHTKLAELGNGMTGKVALVNMSDGRQAALKCSWKRGHALLRGYGHLLDTSKSKYFPKPYGYYKIRNAGDCLFMEVTGPTLDQMRKVSSALIWPAETIASIGLQLMRAVRRMHEEFEIAHRDANPANIVVARETPPGSTLPTKAMLIDFDFGLSIHAEELKIQDVRQTLVSLRYLYDQDSAYWAVNPTTGICTTHQQTYEKCHPGPEALCKAITYACDPSLKKIDYSIVQEHLLNMLKESGHTDKDEIIWPNTLAKLIRANLHTPSF